MSDDLKALKPAPLAVNHDAIRVIEEMLESAKRGEIVDISISYINPQGIPGNNYSVKANHGAQLLGAMQITEFTIMQDLFGE